MRFQRLSDLKRPAPKEITLAVLPEEIPITRFALDKAFAISELVRGLHQESFEWYGFTLAARETPELVTDIGLPHNEENWSEYTRLSAERIALYHEALPPGTVINGWIHSHGSLELKKFSGTDDDNQATVLDFVTTRLRRPVAKREVAVQDLVLLVQDRFDEAELARGSVTLVTDAPVRRATLLESVLGGFCYALVIGDGGWHHQEIHYKNRGLLTGLTQVSKKEAELRVLKTDRFFTSGDLEALREEVREKIQPLTYKPEMLERV